MSTSSQDTLVDAVRRLAIPRGARLLLAVSGGPDSVALLDTAARLAPEVGWALQIGHINHRLRGDESDADERFVRRLARDYGLAINVERVDVAGLASHAHRSVEAAAREARYRALRAWLRAWPGDAIMTGHSLDDQAETVLLRLFRGAGTVGLGGMRSSGTVLRPFLAVDRTVIRRAVEERAIDYRDDASNEDRRFHRNALRRDVMPSILALDPAAPRLIARAAENLQTDADYILAEARRALVALAPRSMGDGISASLSTWRALQPALRRHTLRMLLGQALGSLLDFDMRHIDDIETSLLAGCAITNRLPHEVQIRCHGTRFLITTGPIPPPPAPPPVPLPIPGRATFGDWTVTALQSEATRFGATVEQMMAVRGPSHALLDASQVGQGLTVRSRRPGDRIYPPGLRGSRKIQDVFVDCKVPAHTRDRTPLVTCGDDVVWMPGYGVDRRYAANQETKRLLHLCVKPAAPEP